MLTGLGINAFSHAYLNSRLRVRRLVLYFILVKTIKVFTIPITLQDVKFSHLEV